MIIANSAHQAAIDFVREWGVPVFPTFDKAPMTIRGYKDATTNEESLSKLFGAAPAANGFGFVTGTEIPSGGFHCVLDVDGKNYGDLSLEDLEAKFGSLPPTYRVSTPAGEHFYFKTPKPLGRRIGLFLGIDILAGDGYAIGPGSERSDGGVYEWDSPDDCSLAELPHDLLALLLEQKAASPTECLEDVIPTGKRNSTLASMAGTLRRRGVTEPELRDALDIFNGRCNPPLQSLELDRIAHSVARYQPDQQVIWPGAIDAKAAPNAWPPLFPLSEHSLPAFPVKALPAWIGNFVAYTSEATQTPPAVCASLVLAVLATAAAKRIEVQIMKGWREPLNLYLVVALDPGNRKSGVARSVLRPVFAVEKALAEELADDIRNREIERTVLTSSRKTAEKLAAKAEKSDEREKHLNAARDTAAELEMKPPIFEPQFVADDGTPEVFAKLLDANGERIAIMSGETDIFELLGGRYSKNGSPNFNLFLAGHAGDSVRVDRLGRPPIRLESPCITIGIATQPSVVRGLTEKAGFGDRGLLDRFLYALPPSPIGTRTLSAAAVPTHIRVEYERQVTRLFDSLGQPDRGDARIVYVGEDGFPVFRDFWSGVEVALGPRGDLSQLTGWGSKYPGAVARIAALLHLANHVDDRLPEFIPPETIKAAIAIGEHYRAHSMAAFDLMGAVQETRDAEVVLKWLIGKGKTRFTAPEARTANRGRLKSRERTDKAIAVLVDHGIVRPCPNEATGQRGRPRSLEFDVRPGLSTLDQKTHKPGNGS